MSEKKFYFHTEPQAKLYIHIFSLPKFILILISS
jgi:hypothetical protein